MKCGFNDIRSRYYLERINFRRIVCRIKHYLFFFFFFFFLIVCFTSYFVFSITVLPHSPGVVYYHLLLRRETRIPGVAPSLFE